MAGSPAPAFDLPAQWGGERAALAAARGKVVIVDFWATWCVPCRTSFPKYQDLVNRYDGDVVFFGISEDDEPDDIGAFARETGVTFVLAWDGDKSVAGAYRPETMPTSYVVDRNGLVRYVHGGFRKGDEEILDAQVRSLLD